MMTMTKGARRGATMFCASMLALALAVPASAATGADEKPAAAKAARAVVYCVPQRLVTGSLIPQPKVCKSREQWMKETGIDPVKEQ